MRIFLFSLLSVVPFFTGPAQACTAVYLAKDGRVLAGNNEDFWEWDTKVWFVPPEEGRHGGVYFGYETSFAQGGMNDAGLFFDGFATAPYPVTRSTDKAVFPGNLMDKAMAECETVDQVVALFEAYNLEFLQTAMIFFGDRFGNSVIIEGDLFLRKEGNHQIVTNFYQSRYAPDAYPPGRYRIASAMLEKNDEPSIDRMAEIMAAVHVEDGSYTQYTNICDLKNGIVYLYHFHNYATPVVIDLAEELKKGARTIDIPTLFPDNFAFRMFKEKRKREMRQEEERRRDPDFDPVVLDDYTGRYRITTKQYAGTEFEVKREGDTLKIHGDEIVSLVPEARDRFFQIGRYGSTNYTFGRDAEGRVVSLTQELLGSRIDSMKIE